MALLRSDAGRTLALEVPGFAPAVLVVPAVPERGVEVVVALHGNFDRPEWQCEVWGAALGRDHFVLCPRGIPRTDVSPRADRWTYRDRRAVEREVDAALGALDQRYPGAVEGRGMVLLGFSLGAIHGVPMALASGGRFTRLIAIEGGWETLELGGLRRFAGSGGTRLLLVCAQAPCRERARRVATLARRAGVPIQTDFVLAGHRYDGPVAAVVGEHLSWLLAGDADDGDAAGD